MSKQETSKTMSDWIVCEKCGKELPRVEGSDLGVSLDPLASSPSVLLRGKCACQTMNRPCGGNCNCGS
jgi:hypothetical protein